MPPVGGVMTEGKGVDGVSTSSLAPRRFATATTVIVADHCDVPESASGRPGETPVKLSVATPYKYVSGRARSTSIR